MNLNTVAQSILTSLPPILLDAGIKSVLVLGAAGFVAVCLKRGSAAARHLIWFLAVLALLGLPVLSWCLPGWNILPRWLDARAAQKMEWRNEPSAGPVAPAPPQIVVAQPPGIEMDLNRQEERGTATGNRTVGEARTPAGLTTEAATPPPASFDYRRLASPVWAAGAGLALLPVLLGCLSLWLLERKSRRETASTWLELLRQLMARLGLKRHVALLKTTHRRMPMTWGFLRPRLLLPEESQAWPDERRRVVMLHELAHTRRWDYLTNLITQLACALYWFNPLVWLAARRMTTERERACDDIVLGHGAKPADYAQQILEIAAGLPLGRLAAYGGIPMARPSKLEGRLVAILDAKRNRAALTRLAVLGMLAVLAIVVVPVAMMRAAAPQTTAQESGLRSQLAARAASTNPASAPTNNQPPATAQPLAFMPEIERVLRSTDALGERCYLDFEGGVVAVERTAEDPRRNRQLHRDLKADLTPGAEQWTGIGLQLTPATDGLWNASADQVIATLAEHLADAPPTLPVTRASWLFKTADGNYGLMRVEGMVQTTGGGRGMKIVYKLARAAMKAPPQRSNGAQWIIRPVKVAAKDLPLLERIKQYVAGEPATTGYALEIWEQGPGSEMRLRDDLTRQRIPGGEVFYLKAQNRFYIQWDGGGASTLHYYGPFAGDPVEVLGLAGTNAIPANGTNQAPRTGAVNPKPEAGKELPGVSGTVVDADTREPIENFTVFPGAPAAADLLYFDPSKAQAGQNGRFRLTTTWGVIKVEAPGYLSEMANVRATNADQTNPFSLHKGDGFYGKVVGLFDRPVSGAQVMFNLKFSPARMEGHKLLESQLKQLHHSPVVTTDAKGEFRLPGLAGIISLIVCTEEGFAEVPREVLETNLTIHLQPWDKANEVAAAAGFQLRLRAEKREWSTQEIPMLKADILHVGQQTLESSRDTRLWRIEVDGKWYCSDAFFKRPPVDLKTVKSLTNQPVPLDGSWRVFYPMPSHASDATFGQTGGWQISGMSGTPAKFESGKHTVRLAVFAAQPGTDTIGAICAISNPVVIEIADGGGVRSASASANQQGGWGEATNGLRSRVVIDEPALRAGQPIPIHLEIENVSATTKSYSGPTLPFNEPFIVSDARGKEVPYVGGWTQALVPWPTKIEPGRTNAFKSINLADWYYLRTPGIYTVKWRGEHSFGPPEIAPTLTSLPPSGEVRFEVVADPAASADGDPIGRLLPLLKDKWWLVGVNSGRVHLQPTGDHSEVPARSVGLQYNPTGYKKDEGYIGVWLADEPAGSSPAVIINVREILAGLGGDTAGVQIVTNSVPRPNEYLGKLSRWHVYLNVDSNAAKAWPTAREDIKRVLSAE